MFQYAEKFRYVAFIACMPVSFLLAGFTTSNAAELSIETSGKCQLVFSGNVEAGDLQKFKASTDALKWTGAFKEEIVESSYDRLVCLDSPGGNYIEGRLIAQHIFDNGIGTRVGPYGQCYSACAIMFMAGRSMGGEFDGTHRELDINGKVGFHAVYPNISDDAKLNGKQAKELFYTANLIVADLIRFASYKSTFSLKSIISPSLIASMLEKPSNDLSFVQSVEDVSKWGIDLTGYSKNSKINTRMIAQACTNFQSWISDQPSEDVTNKTYPTVEGTQLLGQDADANVFKIDTGGMEDSHCIVSIEYAEEGPSITLCSVDDFSGVRYGNCPEFGVPLEPFQMLPPGFPIAHLQPE